MATVYSYSRFSCSNQDAVESFRRQAAILDSWLKRHPEHELDETLVLKDCAKTAFKSKGKHISLEDRSKLEPKERTKLDRQGTNLDPNKGDLGVFIEMAKRGEISRGSILAVEDLDRFSRTPPSVAYEAFVELVETGVRILTLSPEILVDQKNMNEMHVTFPIMTKIQLSHDESLKKSDRLKASWAARRKAAQEGNKKSVGNYPAWLKSKEDGGFEIIPEKADVVKYIFDLSDKYSVGGHGIVRLVDEMPRFSRAYADKEWFPTTDSSITWLLRNKAVIGIYQPNAMINGKWLPDGEPIYNFFPAIISEEQFYRVQLGLDRRKLHHGPASKESNLFTGMLKSENKVPFLAKAGYYWAPDSVSPSITHVEQIIFTFIKQLTIPSEIGSEKEMNKLKDELSVINAKIKDVSDHMEQAADISVYFGMLDKLQNVRRQLMSKIEYCMPHYDPTVSLKKVQNLIGQHQSLSKDGTDLKETRAQLKPKLGELIEEIVMVGQRIKAYRECCMEITLRKSIFGEDNKRHVCGVTHKGELINISFDCKEDYLQSVMTDKEKAIAAKRLEAKANKVGRIRKLSKADIQRIFELHKQGMTQVEIAKLYDVTQAHISWTMKQNTVA